MGKYMVGPTPEQEPSIEGLMPPYGMFSFPPFGGEIKNYTWIPRSSSSTPWAHHAIYGNWVVLAVIGTHLIRCMSHPIQVGSRHPNNLSLSFTSLTSPLSLSSTFDIKRT
jgi:hypothetical protein|nr:hypothetical protein Q903MT_gene2060 [Picea sitchensis]